MQQFHRDFDTFWGTVCHDETCSNLALEIVDLGADGGIEVSIHLGQPSSLVFEVLLVDPESDLLLTHGSIETETFWKCIRDHVNNEAITQLFLTARCHSSPMPNAVSARRIGYAEMRNVRFFRLIDDILDEFTTREPCLSVEVNVTYRNAKNVRIIELRILMIWGRGWLGVVD